MIETIVKWALAALVVAAVVYAIFFGYETWRDGKVAEGDKAGAARIQGQWDADNVKRAKETLAAVAKARTEEQEKARLAAKGEKDAHDKAAAKAAQDLVAARRSAALAGGMSGNIAALDRAARALDLPGAASCPGEFAKQRDAAILARSLLGACVAEYRSLGQDADDAIRAVHLKLDTALSYISAVAPP